LLRKRVVDGENTGEFDTATEHDIFFLLVWCLFWVLLRSLFVTPFVLWFVCLWICCMKEEDCYCGNVRRLFVVVFFLVICGQCSVP
jgi:hypothetical protein